MQHGKKYTGGGPEGRPRATVSGRRGRGPGQADLQDLLRLHCRGVDAPWCRPAQRPTRWSAAPVNLPHGTGRPPGSWSSPTAEGRGSQAAAPGLRGLGRGSSIKVAGGWIDFDAVVATPRSDGQVGRPGARPARLMPNPDGTVTMDVSPRPSPDIKGGKIEFRVDKHSNLHFIISKGQFQRRPARRQLTLPSTRCTAPTVDRQGRYVKKIVVSDDGPRYPG